MTTFSNKLKLGFTSFALLVALATPVKANVISDTFDGYNARHGGNGFADRWKEGFKAQGAPLKGSIAFSTPSVNISGSDFIKVRSASLTGGCNGIDWDFGGLDFINSDKAIQFIETVAQQAPMMIAYTVIQQLAEPIFTALAKVQDEAKKMLAISANSCDVAKKIASATLDATGTKNLNWFEGKCADQKNENGDSSSFYSAATAGVCNLNKATTWMSKKRKEWENSGNSVSPARLTEEVANLTWELIMYNGGLEIEPDKSYKQQSDAVKLQMARAEFIMNTIGTWKHKTISDAEQTDGQLGLSKIEPAISADQAEGIAMCGFDYMEQKGATNNWNTIISGITDPSIKDIAINFQTICETYFLPDEIYSCAHGNLLQCVKCEASASETLTIDGKSWSSCPLSGIDDKYYSDTISDELGSLTADNSHFYREFKEGIAPKIVKAVTKALSNLDSNLSPIDNNTDFALISEYGMFDFYKLFNLYTYQPKVALILIRNALPIMAKDIANQLLRKIIFTSNLTGTLGKGKIDTEKLPMPKDFQEAYSEFTFAFDQKTLTDLEGFQAEFAIQDAISQRIWAAEKLLNNSVAYRMIRDKKVRVNSFNETSTTTSIINTP